jgi:predicted TIM-barrel fold metal-dependent hydrolase
MNILDADTHVDETDETWRYLAASEAKYKPVTVMPMEEMAPGRTAPGYNRYWLIDGQLHVRRIRDDARTGTTEVTRELKDVEARVRHMDELGIETQVVFPTLFLHYLTGSPDVQIALCKSYNRWLAEKCGQSNGRIRWVPVLPYLDIDAAVDELRWASDRGAAGFFKLATDLGRRVTDPYFFPVYEAANDLDLPMCIHTGSGEPGLASLAPSEGIPVNIPEAFYSVVFNGLADKFTKLRFGFIEAGASWIPYVLDRLRARQERMAWAYTFDIKDDLFRKSRIFVTCQTVEDLPYLLQFGTEDNLMLGTDYTHADASAEIQSFEILQRWGDEGRVSKEVVRKILDDNPRSFYRL